MIDIVCGLALVAKKYGKGKNHELAKTLRKLVNYSLFKSEYIPIVFIALCQTEPKSFSLHLPLVKEHFQKMHSEQSNIEDSRLTAQKVAHYVQTDIIQENIAQIPDWLLWGLFQCENAPLVIVRANN